MIGLPFLLGFLCYALGNKPLGFAFFMSIPIIIIAIINSEMKQKRTLERFDTLMKWIENHKRYCEFECYDLFTNNIPRFCLYATNFDKMFRRSWKVMLVTIGITLVTVRLNCQNVINGALKSQMCFSTNSKSVANN